VFCLPGKGVRGCVCTGKELELELEKN